MFIKLPNYASRFHAEPLTDAVVFIERTTFDWFMNTGLIDLAVYADEDSAYGDRQPIDKMTLTLPSVTLPGFAALPELVAAHQGAVATLMGAMVGVILADPRFAGGEVREGDVIARPKEG